MSWIDDAVQKIKDTINNGAQLPDAEGYSTTVQDWQPQETVVNNDENNDITTNPEGYGNTVENWQATEDIPNPVDEIVNTVKDRLTNGVEQPGEGYSQSFTQEQQPQQDDLLTFADNYMKNKGDQEGFHQTAMDTGLKEQPKDLLTFADDYMKRKNAPKDLETLSKGVMGAVDYLKEPAAAALEAIGNLQRPEGALVELKGYNDGKFNDASALDALKKGWNKKTSWEELIDENYRKEHPYISKGVGLAGDVVLDPLWLLPPVKIAQLIGKAAKATGVTEKLAPTSEKLAQSELGQKVTSTIEDVLGHNRVADETYDFKAGRATDQVNTDSEILQDVKKAEKTYGKNSMNPLTDYVEATDRPIAKDNNFANEPWQMTKAQFAENGYAPNFLYHVGPDVSEIKPNMSYGMNNPVVWLSESPIANHPGDFIYAIDKNKLTSDKFIQSPNRFLNYSETIPSEAISYKFPKKESISHKDFVQQAIEKGLPVPESVLKEYPTLANKTIENKVIGAHTNGTLVDEIKNGNISKEEAFAALRNSDKEIPDYLLQTHQLQAKEAGQAIPDYVYRDQILAQIPNEGLRKAIQSIGDKVIDYNKKTSKELLDRKFLTDPQYVKFMEGSHLRRSFKQYDSPEEFLSAIQKVGTDEEYINAYQKISKGDLVAKGTASHKVDMGNFINRLNLSPETLEKLGEIRKPAYKIADTFDRNSKVLREDDFLNNIGKMWGTDGKTAARLSKTLPDSRKYVQIPNTEAYRSLAGKWVPKDVSAQVLNVTGMTQQPGKLGATWQKMVSWWKVEKLAQPASVMRNFYSGMPMANVFGKVPILSMPKYMTKAAQVFKQGYKSDAYKEAKSTGIFDNVWSKQELQNILGNNPKGIKWAADKAMNAFGAPDQYWRMVTYLYHKDHGKSTKDAAKLANNALFDYSAAPEWINALSKNGVIPFAKFPFFAAKATAKSAWGNPASLSKWQKPMNGNDEDKENMQKLMPDYMKGKSLLPLWDGKKTVNGKEVPVKNNLDLSYILPFANDVSVGNPAIDALTLARTGKNSLGMTVVDDNMTAQDKVKAYAKFYADAFGPALLASYNGGKLWDAYKGNVDAKGRQYDLPSAAAQTILGLKNVPVNVDEMFHSQTTHLKSEMQRTEALRSKINKNMSMPQTQKIEKLKEYDRQKKEIQLQLHGVGQAYRSIKNKGGQ